MPPTISDDPKAPKTLAGNPTYTPRFEAQLRMLPIASELSAWLRPGFMSWVWAVQGFTALWVGVEEFEASPPGEVLRMLVADSGTGNRK